MTHNTIEKHTGIFLFASGIFKFFASLQLAVCLLVTLMGVLTAGTFIESAHGTDAARIVVYESLWFSLLLVLLAVNLAAAALSRWPWQKKHIGFVITHLGIITLLAGSLVTQQTMIDGQMVLAEGETDSYVTLPEPLLYIAAHEASLDWIIYLQKKAFAWEGRQVMRPGEGAPLPFTATVTAFYPKARGEDNVTASESGPAALKLRLKNSFLNQEQWLVENDPQLGLVQMGPAKLRFTDKLLEEKNEALPPGGYLEFEGSDRHIHVPLGENPGEIAVEGTDYKIKVVRVFKKAVVNGKELTEQEAGEPNPAVQFLLTGKGVEEKHTAFANFPDFPTMHGMKPSASGFRILYRTSETGSRGQSHELRFVKTPEGLKAQVQTGLKIETIPVELNKETPLGWMDLRFTIENYHPHAAREKKFTPLESGSQAEDAVSALRLELDNGKERKTFWLSEGGKETRVLNGKGYDFVFGRKRIPAGFRLTLKDFRLEHYPGTENPASFESDVTLKDDGRGFVRDQTISMNKPFVYRGYRIYQSGYTLPETPGAHEISIFAVGKDPGVPVKYAAAIIMVIGIVTMFYTRRPPPSVRAAKAE